MTGITPDGIEIDRDFAATPERVFSALSTAEGFAQWFGGSMVDVPADTLDYVAEPGRAWSAVMVLPDGHKIAWAGEFIEVTPSTRLVLTLTDQPDDDARAALTLDLTPTADGTHLHATQEAPGFSDEQKLATIEGWQAFLDVVGEVAAA